MLNVFMLNIVMLNVIMLNIILLNVIMLNVIMLSVVVSFSQPKAREKGGKSETKLTDTKMNNFSLSMELHNFLHFH
jgi:hypothetical protein